MRLAGGGSWRISVSDGNGLTDGALWIRAVERIDVPEDDLVPGPLDLAVLPPPSVSYDATLGAEWLRWWWSLVDAPRARGPVPRGPVPEPAYGTPDPLGLATLPALRQIIARRWPEVLAWQRVRNRLQERDTWIPPTKLDGNVVRTVERDMGRPARPFEVEFWLLPVRDDTIRRVYEHRYLVPERVYRGPRWADWLRELVSRIG
jgi:hypothetical protein